MKTLYLECAMGAERVKAEYEDIAALAREHNKAEYEDIAALAKELNLPLETVREAVRKACR